MGLFSLQAAVAKMCLSTSRLLSGLACVRSTRDKPSSTRFRASAAKGPRPTLGSSSGYAVIECPLWVKSRHWSTSNQCPLYPQKRTLVEHVCYVCFVPKGDICAAPIDVPPLFQVMTNF